MPRHRYGRRLVRNDGYPRPASVCTIYRFELLHNGFDDLLSVVVLPESQHRPAVLSEDFVHAAVSVPIGVDLLAPPVGIGFGCRGVDGAAVPEAAVEEHDELTTGPYDVAAELMVGQRPAVDPVAIAQGVKSPPDLQLDARVCRLLRLHLSSDMLKRGREVLAQRHAPSSANGIQPSGAKDRGAPRSGVRRLT